MVQNQLEEINILVMFEIDYVIIRMTHMSHLIEFQKNWVTYDDSYDYFHLLRNDYVIQKQLRNHYVKVWTTHMSHKIELKKMSYQWWLIRVFPPIT